MCEIIAFPLKGQKPCAASDKVAAELSIKFPDDFMENSITGEFYCSFESWDRLAKFFRRLGYDVQGLTTVAELYPLWVSATSDASAVLGYLEHPSRFMAAHQADHKEWLDYICAVANGNVELARNYIRGDAADAALDLLI